MPIVPLYGHETLRRRLGDALAAGRLPASLLLHGPQGVGKQRLALWLGQALLCTGAGGGDGARPCGRCQACRYALDLSHPDLHWYFPRPRLKDADPDAAEVRGDYVDAIAARLADRGLYEPAEGTEGLFVATIRTIVRSASAAPAMGRRKVFVVGDAERMVPQEGSEFAANAFLKMLEEPPVETTIVLTSSEPGALLPTIRSRVVAVRVPLLPDDSVRAFVEDDTVRARLDKEGLPSSATDRVRLAGGAPGSLLAGRARGDALAAAKRFVEAATAGRDAAFRLAICQGSARARGGFAETLDALTVVLHERARSAAARGDDRRAVGAARAMTAVEEAKQRAAGNITPQLVSAALLRDLRELLR